MTGRSLKLATLKHFGGAKLVGTWKQIKIKFNYNSKFILGLQSVQKVSVISSTWCCHQRQKNSLGDSPPHKNVSHIFPVDLETDLSNLILQGDYFVVNLS